MVGLGQPLYAYCPLVTINSVPFHSQSALVWIIKRRVHAGGVMRSRGSRGRRGQLRRRPSPGASWAVGVARPLSRHLLHHPHCLDPAGHRACRYSVTCRSVFRIIGVQSKQWSLKIKSQVNPFPGEISFFLPSERGLKASFSLRESVLVAQLCLILCDPMGCSPPGSSVCGILQARILQWVAIPFSRGSSRPRD